MDDQGFEFQPTTRREAKRFEPPPWEKEAFDRLGVGPHEETAQARSQEQEPIVAVPPVAEPTVTVPVAEPVRAERVSRQKTASGAQLDEAQVIEMLAALTAEEPKLDEVYDRVAMVSGLGVSLLGCVLVFWGMAGLVSARNTGTTGYVAGAGLFVFGAFFIGMGVWFVYRTLKKRGVL